MTFQEALTNNALQKISLAKMVQAMGEKLSNGEPYEDLWLHIRFIRQFQKLLDVQFSIGDYDLTVINGAVNKITLYLGNYSVTDSYSAVNYIEINANGQRSVDQSNVTFITLADVTLSTYTGKEGQVIAVNSTGTGLTTKQVYSKTEVDTLVAANSGDVASVNGQTGAVVLTKTDVGLGSVDNTSDANKPISSATQTALNAKENTITPGSTAQYFRGDKTFQTLNTTAVTEGTNQYFTEARVRSSVLTGYSLGTNTTLSATDSLLAAFGKLQAQLNSKGTGTVTSVGLVLPTGLSVSPATITTSNTFSVSFTAGYSIPTTANQNNWSAAFSWGDHSAQNYIKFSSLLTGYNTGTNTALSESDTVIAAFGKLQGQINAKANSSAVVTKTGNVAFMGTGNRSVTVNANGDLSATNLEVEGFVTDTDVITAITGATYNSGNNYTAILSPANSKVFYAGQLYKAGTDLYIAVADNNAYKIGNGSGGGLSLSSAITGYTVGANAALTATDTILQAFGKLQGQFNNLVGGGGSGTVTSVGMTVPTGLSVSPTTISTSGTFALNFTAGYAIPTTASQTNWDSAFSWGNHAAQSYIKLSSVLTGYTTGANTALAATDTLLAALGKIQGQLNSKTSNDGTVTSVAITVPTGLSITPASISTSGTFVITFTSGYAIPTTAKQSDWDTAFGWGNHAVQSYIKLSSVLTGYTVGTNAALAATDTILAAFGKVQAQINAKGAGTVTSVGLTVPTGLSVTPASITSSGTFAVSFTAGYSIPTTTDQTNWSTAFGWGNHSTQSYIKLSSVLTGYSVGTNAALADTDTILAAFGKLQAQANSFIPKTGQSGNYTGTAVYTGGGFIAGDSTDCTALQQSAVQLKVGGISLFLMPAALTAQRTIVFPDKSDTIATLSDILSTLLTGYSVGANSALSTADTILAAFGKLQAQINNISVSGGTGTVTSVGMTVPTGLSVTPSTISSSGTFAVSFAAGYSIPTTADQADWIKLSSVITGYAVGANTALAATDTVLAAFGKLQAQINNLVGGGGGSITIDSVPTDGNTTNAVSSDGVFDALATKQNTITAGTTAQYYRGDKTWQDFATAARSAVVAPVHNGTNLQTLSSLTTFSGTLTFGANSSQYAVFTDPNTGGTATLNQIAGSTANSYVVLENASTISITITHAYASAASNDYKIHCPGNVNYTLAVGEVILLLRRNSSSINTGLAIMASSIAGKVGVTLDAVPTNGNTANAVSSDGVFDALALKQDTITAGTTSQYYRGDKSWQTLDKTAVGLANVDNTTDANKPVSTATQTALNAKQNLNLTLNDRTANYTLVLTDSGNLVRMNLAGANNLTVPPNSSVAFPTGTQILISQLGAGQTTFVPGSGVTIQSSGAKLKLTGQYSTASLIKVATDTWLLSGDISA